MELKLRINEGISCQWNLEITSFSQSPKSVLSSMVATGYMRLLSTWNVAKLKCKIYAKFWKLIMQKIKTF